VGRGIAQQSNPKPYLIQSPDIWGQAAVDTEHLAIDDGAEGEVIKHLHTVPPRVGVAVLALALVIKTIHLA
jgi:hypothetical protein